MEAAKIKYILTQQQIEKFCDIMGVDQANVEQLNALRCLNTEYIRDILIQHDYHELTKGIEYLQTLKKSYNYSEIKKALAKAYKMPENEINASIQGKNNGTMHFCTKCGKRITGKQNQRTNGLCSECLVDTLDL